MSRAESHLKVLIDYAKKNFAKGYSQDAIKWSLVKQGNMKHEVDKAISVAQQEMAAEASKRIAQQQKMPEPQVTIVDEPVKKPSFFKRLFGNE